MAQSSSATRSAIGCSLLGRTKEGYSIDYSCSYSAESRFTFSLRISYDSHSFHTTPSLNSTYCRYEYFVLILYNTEDALNET